MAEANPSPSAPGGSFAGTWEIVGLAIYLILVGTFSLWMLIHRWPRCTPESAASQTMQPAPAKPETPSPPAGTGAPAEPEMGTGTGTGTETPEGTGTPAGTENESRSDTKHAGTTGAPSPAPIVPKGGPIEGGTPVVLQGSGFPPGAQVHFGEAEAFDVVVVNERKITARTPPHDAGSVTVDVVNPDGTKKPLGTFIYGCEPLAGGELLLLVALAGALAGTVHAARSLYYFVGNRFFKRSWALMYLLLPFVGAALASVFYIVFIAGLYDPQKGERSLLIVGVAALVGMFSEQAVEKLKKIAEAIFTTPPPAKDKVPAAKVNAIDPKTGKAAGGEEVTITGEGFGTGTRVFFGEQDVAPKSIEPTKLVVIAPAHAVGKVHLIVDVPGSSPCAVVDGYEYL